MKNILLVAPYGGIAGGISRWTGHLLYYYKKCGYNDCKIDLVSTARSTFISANKTIIMRFWNAWIDYRKILSDFNSKVCENHDIVHLTSSGSFSLYRDLYLINKAKNKGLKTVIHFRFGRIPELAQQNNWEWKLLKRVVLKADRTIVLDKMSYETLLSIGITSVKILPNPVAPIVEKVVSENKISHKKGEILFVGHVLRTKGIFELLEACSTIGGIHLKIVGHITQYMQQEIERIYGKPEWLSICGEMPYEEVVKEMMGCDVFVLPTYTEGFPNVIIEAMAAGCAIVTTPVGAIPEMLESEDNKHYGLLVEPHDSSKLHEAIISLLKNDSLKNEMRKNVRIRVFERYNMPAVWKQLVSIWNNC